jgi:hypothetical protein
MTHARHDDHVDSVFVQRNGVGGGVVRINRDGPEITRYAGSKRAKLPPAFQSELWCGESTIAVLSFAVNQRFLGTIPFVANAFVSGSILAEGY